MSVSGRADALRLAKRALDETRRSPTARGVAAGAGAAALARFSGVRPKPAVGLALSAGLLQRELRSAAIRLRREVRSGAHAPALASIVGDEAIFGDAAIEPDMGRLIWEQVRLGPKMVVECGCGASTLLIGSILKRSGAGKVVAIENHEGFARSVAGWAGALALDDYVEIVVADLRDQTIGGKPVRWYDLSTVTGRVTEPIDLLLVDGPPSRGRWARWPAVEVFHDQLAATATVLLDDGRRRGERLTAFRWADSHDDLDLYWIDTVKGTWKLTRSPTAAPPSPPVALARRLGRTINPRPAGFELGQIRR